MKTQLIDQARGTNMGVGHGERSVRSTVDQLKVSEVDVKGFLVRLIDAPGFDDTLTSDADTLRLISSWFARE